MFHRPSSVTACPFFHFLKMSSYSMKQLNLFWRKKEKMFCKTGLYTIYSTFFSILPKKIKLLHCDTFWQDLNLTVKPSKSRKSWHKTLFPFWNIAPVLSKCSHCSSIPVAIFFSAFLILKLPFSEIKHCDYLTLEYRVAMPTKCRFFAKNENIIMLD